MQEYRVYILGPDGHIKKCADVLCANEETAKESAKQLVDCQDVELWQRDRRVATFKRQ